MFSARQLVKACRYQALFKSSLVLRTRSPLAYSAVRYYASNNGSNNNGSDPAVKVRSGKNGSNSEEGSNSADKTEKPNTTDENKPPSDVTEETNRSEAADSEPKRSTSSSNPEDERPRGGRRRQLRKSNDDDDKGSKGRGAESAGGVEESGKPAESRASHFGFRPASPDNKRQTLCLALPDRPAIPGYHRACRIQDPEIIYAIRRIFYDNLQEQCVAVFLRKPESEDTSEVLKDVNDVYPVGAYCRIGGVFSRYEDGQPGCTITLLPLSRVSVGELVESKPSTGVTAEADKNTNMDVTSFDTAYSNANFYSLQVPWMKGVKTIEHNEYDVHDQDIQALCAQIIEVLRQLSQLSLIFREQIASFAIISLKPTNEAFGDPAALADFAAAMSEGSSDVQEILETRDVKVRLEKALELVKKELLQINLQDKFKKNVDAKLQNRYKKVYLEEKMTEIKKELGIENKEKSTDVFRERAAKLSMPELAQKAFDEEIVKLESTDPSSLEHSMTRNYVDWLTQMPWGVFSEDKYDIKEARKILDKGHYGLKDVKDRILEFIATARLSGSVDGKIICFCGPPGVGKTSIGKSIAEALGRKFSRISVGGMHDVSEIKGHRRTYVGSVPGRIIQTLKQTQTQNPLILIDEIDKVGRVNLHGDPSAALLEVLDPEQNTSFVDSYLDVPIDVSKVLFVCTANYIESIPAPLKDRMEIIDISGYVASERVSIAEQYLIPQSLKVSGLENLNVEIKHDAIEKLVSLYSRENGVRGLKKLIEKVHRKLALKVVEEYDTGEDTIIPIEATSTENVKTENKPSNPAAASGSTVMNASSTAVEDSKTKAVETESIYDPKKMGGKEMDKEDHPATKKIAKLNIPADKKFTVDVDGLREYLGPPVHLEDRMYDVTPSGVIMGLAFTEMGGAPLYIESVLQQPLSADAKPEFRRTGQLGDVMNESSSIAYSFCKMFMSKNFPENRFFDKAHIHLHCPEGAIKKDGPSAGVTMTTSLLSLALDRPLDPTACMTGEITLTGKVLRIGGLREKTMAARLAGAKTIFFPYDNQADWENIPEYIREGLEAVPVKWYQDIFDRLFADLDKNKAQTMWKSQLKKKKKDDDE